MKHNRNLGDMLKFDALDVAEQVTGKSYKEDKVTESLGVGLHLLHVQEKRQALEEAGDTHYSSSIEWYQMVATGLGFMTMYEETFKCKTSKQEETKYICYRERGGILLVWDTYRGNANNSHFYYNWEPKPEVEHYEYTSSGSWVNIEGEDELRVWAGNHHAIEALKFNLLGLEQTGKFITPYIEDPMLPWLTNREEYDSLQSLPFDKMINECHKITAEKLKKTPRVIQDIFKISKRNR